MLSEVGDVGERVAPELREIGREIAPGKSIVPVVGYLRELAFLVRTAGTIRTAIGSIRRIVGALKRYSQARRGAAGTRRRTRGHRGHAHHSVASVEVRRQRR